MLDYNKSVMQHLSLSTVLFFLILYFFLKFRFRIIHTILYEL